LTLIDSGAVVDQLEPVQVHEQDGHRVPARPPQPLLQALGEQGPVGQPGELVVERLVHGVHGAGVGQGEAGVLGEGSRTSCSVLVKVRPGR
jgi:hypothetical protein